MGTIYKHYIYHPGLGTKQGEVDFLSASPHFLGNHPN